MSRDVIFPLSSATMTSAVFSSLFSSPDTPRRSSLGRMVNQSTMLLMVSIGSLILILALLILFHENANATKGYDLRNLEGDRSAALLEQEVLSMQISEAQALNHLQNDAQIQSMIAVKNPLYAHEVPAVAMKTASTTN